MVVDGERVVELPEARVINSVTREDLNEAISSLRSSVAIEVKSMLKDFLEGLRLPTNPLRVVNLKTSESDANLFGHLLRSGIAGLYEIYFWIFKSSLYGFPQQLKQFTSPHQ